MCALIAMIVLQERTRLAGIEQDGKSATLQRALVCLLTLWLFLIFFKTAANGNVSKLTREVSAKSDANEKVTFFEGLFTTS